MTADFRDETGIAAYFSQFLVGKMHQSLVPGLRRISVCCHIALDESMAARWLLTIETGQLTGIVHGDGESQCGFSLSTAVFAEIIAGRLAPQKAFFKRQVRIDGRLDLGLRLATVLAAFFRQHPFDPTQE